MKLLFLHSNQPDYLAESLLHGLRQVLGSDCVDSPRYDSLYAPLHPGVRAKLRGHGFTVYGLLPDDPELQAERFYWQRAPQKFDLFVIANIWWQFDQYAELSRMVGPERIAVLDGIDSPECFPYALRLINKPWAWLSSLRRSHYFKRELMNEGRSLGLGRILPRWARHKFDKPRGVLPTAFSIPREKITRVTSAQKTKDFNRDIVDPEVSMGLAQTDRHLPGATENYPFESETEYYRDLALSRFGITTKRGGWDCLRHYEMAANGCVLAFRELDQKPQDCAPHGLDRTNCLIYQNREDLMNQVRNMSASHYEELLEATYQWVEAQTTEVRARQFLAACAK